MRERLVELRELRDRVAKLTGPDQVVDYALIQFFMSQEDYNQICKRRDNWLFGFTSSIHAVEALRQRLLPGSYVRAENSDGGCWLALMAVPGKRSLTTTAPTEPLARLLALLDVLIAKDASP